MIVLVVGSSVKGASRWIDLGLLRIQPAELTKPAAVSLYRQLSGA